MRTALRARRLLGIGLLAGMAAAAPATAIAGPPAPDVPSKIRVEDGHKPFLIGHATGVQIYGCKAAGDGFAWSLLAPSADIRDDQGHLLMTHYGGPTWEARDGSLAKARRDDGVNVDPTAIDWLRLAVTSATAGADGDRLAAATWIQRINTTGGVMPPAGTCHADAVGSVEEIPYTADYVFWKRSPS